MEREVQHEPEVYEPHVLEGEDEIPHQPADRADYAPAPAAGFAAARIALWIALGVFVVVVAIVLYAIAT